MILIAEEYYLMFWYPAFYMLYVSKGVQSFELWRARKGSKAPNSCIPANWSERTWAKSNIAYDFLCI